MLPMVVTVTMASAAMFTQVVDRATYIVKAEQVSCLGQQKFRAFHICRCMAREGWICFSLPGATRSLLLVLSVHSNQPSTQL